MEMNGNSRYHRSMALSLAREERSSKCGKEKKNFNMQGMGLDNDRSILSTDWIPKGPGGPGAPDEVGRKSGPKVVT